MIDPGQVLNDTYEITERLGSGGGGIIYKAYHKRMRKFVAIKLIKDDIKGELRNRSEVDVLKNLKNDYLPQVIDFVEDGNDVYTVMEFIEGKNFKQLIGEGRSFTEAQVRKYALQLCAAVKYLHSQVPPIIHSDIKPANIMLTPQDDICLIDFNISTIADKGIANAQGGSQYFGAPEQFKCLVNIPEVIDEFHEETRFLSEAEETVYSGENNETELISHTYPPADNCVSKQKTKNIGKAYINVRTDIYGIGTSLYYILTGRIPQCGRPDFRGIDVSSHMRDVISKAMSDDPNSRYRNAAEMEAELSGKKRAVPVKAFAAAAAAVLCIAVVVGISFRENNGSVSTIAADTSVSEVDNVSELPAFSSETKAAAEETTVHETVSETQTEQEYGILEYHPNGKVKCEKLKPDSEGNYQLMWYEPNGAKDIIEYYNSDDEFMLVTIYFTDKTSASCVPEITENGYIITVEYDSADYPYLKYVKRNDRTTEAVIYCDANKNELFRKTYTIEYYDDGSHKITWYDQNGQISQIVTYYLDGSKTADFFRNGKRYKTQTLDSSGKLIENIDYDASGNVITAQ